MGKLTEVRKAYVRIPAAQTSRGGLVGRKQLQGAAQEAAQSQWKKQLVGKADRDQNSLRSPVPTTMVMPDAKHKASAIHAKGTFQGGRSGGVGRHLTRDQNSSPGATKVRTPTLREINGKFAGEGYGVKMYTPIGHKGSQRGAVHTKGIFHTTKGKGPAAVGHAVGHNVRKGMLGEYELANMQVHAGNRVGHRIPVEKGLARSAKAIWTGGLSEARPKRVHPKSIREYGVKNTVADIATGGLTAIRRNKR